MGNDGTFYVLGRGFEEEAYYYYLISFDEEGALIRNLDVTEACQSVSAGGFISCVADAKGSVYVWDKVEPQKLVVLQEDGTLFKETEFADEHIQSIACYEDVVYFSGENTLYRLDDDLQLTKVMELPEDRGISQIAAHSSGLLYGCYDGLFGCSVENRITNELITWNELGLDGKEISHFYADERGRICVLKRAKDTISIATLQFQQPKAEAGMENQNMNQNVC